MPRPSKKSIQKLLSITHARTFRSQSHTSSTSSTPAPDTDHTSSPSPSSPVLQGSPSNSVEDFGALNIEDDQISASFMSGSDQGEELPVEDYDNIIELEDNEEDDDLELLKGFELRESLQRRGEAEEAEIEVFRRVQELEFDRKLPGYERLLEGISKTKWKHAEAKRSMGYLGNSARTQRQQRAKIVGEKAKQNS